MRGEDSAGRAGERGGHPLLTVEVAADEGRIAKEHEGGGDVAGLAQARGGRERFERGAEPLAVIGDELAHGARIGILGGRVDEGASARVPVADVLLDPADHELEQHLGIG